MTLFFYFSASLIKITLREKIKKVDKYWIVEDSKDGFIKVLRPRNVCSFQRLLFSGNKNECKTFLKEKIGSIKPIKWGKEI